MAVINISNTVPGIQRLELLSVVCRDIVIVAADNANGMKTMPSVKVSRSHWVLTSLPCRKALITHKIYLCLIYLRVWLRHKIHIPHII